MSQAAAGLTSTSGVEGAAAAQRAADVRRKLLTGAQEVEGLPSPEASFLIGQWTASRPSQIQGSVQYPGSITGKVSDFA
jgi:hypothetical protein